MKNLWFLGVLLFSCSLAAEPAKPRTLDAITQWRFASEAPLSSSPSVYLSQVYIGDLQGNIYALDAATGKPLWQFKAAAPVRTRPIAHASGVIVAAGDTLYSLDIKGQLSWSSQFEAKANKEVLDPWDIYRSSPFLDNKTIYIGTENGELYGYNLTSGKRIYTCKTRVASPIRNQPVSDDQNVYFGNWQGEFFACSLRSSSVVWQYDTRKDKTFSWVNAIQNRATVYRGTVCFTGRHCRHYCLNSSTGEQRDVLVSPTDQWLIGDPAQQDNLVVFGTSDQHLLYARDLRSFKTLWQAKTAGRTWGAAWIGSQAVYAVNNKLQKFDRETGKLIEEIALPEVYPLRTFGSYEDARPSSHSDVIMVADHLIFAIDNGTVVATKPF